jgi:hypothetical protein
MSVVEQVTQAEPSMLEAVSRRLPSAQEFAATNTVRGDAHEAIEYLRMSLTRAFEAEDFDLTAEQAWHLTCFADYARLDAEGIVEEANTIQSLVEDLYHATVERRDYEVAERDRD